METSFMNWRQLLNSIKIVGEATFPEQFSNLITDGVSQQLFMSAETPCFGQECQTKRSYLKVQSYSSGLTAVKDKAIPSPCSYASRDCLIRSVVQTKEHMSFSVMGFGVILFLNFKKIKEKELTLQRSSSFGFLSWG